MICRGEVVVARREPCMTDLALPAPAVLLLCLLLLSWTKHLASPTSWEGSWEGKIWSVVVEWYAFSNMLNWWLYGNGAIGVRSWEQNAVYEDVHLTPVFIAGWVLQRKVKASRLRMWGFWSSWNSTWLMNWSCNGQFMRCSSGCV